MRKLILALFVALPALAFGQGLTAQCNPNYLPTMPEDAGTVTHVTWNGTALVDSKSAGWTMTGTVRQVPARPYITNRAGAGDFATASRYYTNPVNSFTDFAGNFYGCVVWLNATTTTEGIVSDGNETNAGWRLQLNGGTDLIFTADGFAGGTKGATAAGIAPWGVNVACFGVSGTTVMVKANGGAIVTATATGPYTAATAQVGYLGRTTGSAAVGGKIIYEVLLSSGTPSDALFTEIQRQLLNPKGRCK